MKNVFLIFASVLLALGCSKKNNESAHTTIPVSLVRGDIASAVEIATNEAGGHVTYQVQINLSEAKQAEIRKLSEKNPNRKVSVMIGPTMITKMRMPAKPLTGTVGWTIACDSYDEARADAEALSELSR